MGQAPEGSLLEQAVEQKIVDRAEFVEWWGEKVTPHRTRKSVRADQGEQKMVDAERLTGIKQQQVSKWRARLLKPDEYRELLYGVAYRCMMALRSMSSADVPQLSVPAAQASATS